MDFELSEEQIMSRDMARKFAEQEILPTLKENERQERFDPGIIKKMASKGLLAPHLPEEYGGLELDYVCLSHYLGAALWIASQAVKIHGSYGTFDDYPVGHHYQDAITATILGGTAQMHQLTIGQQLLEMAAFK